jgi:hypothetical protein
MNSYDQNKKDKKKGFLPFFSRLFDTSSKAATGLAGGAGRAALGGAAKGGFFASLFATKAGVVGLVLGAATIAAGIGLVYNYMEPSSSGKVYTPNLFSNAYYDEAQRQANAERARYSSEVPAQSSLDAFKKVAKEELKSEEPIDENATDEASNGSEDINGANASSENADVNASGGGYGQVNPGIGGDRKLQSNLGFDAKGAAGGGSSQNRLQTSGGMWGGIGKQFAPISRNASTANAAKASQMNKALASRVVASPKYAVPNVNKKGAFGQAKFAAKTGKSAAYDASDAGARTTAEQAFSGETAGSGDVATPIGGTGLGGSGLSQGDKLKANDPTLNTDEYTPPTPEKTDDSPWKKLTDYALYAMLAAAGFIAISSLLANKAKALLANPITAAGAVGLFNAAKVFAYLAMAAAAAVIGIAVMLASKYGQKMMGIMYGMVGAALIYQAYKALSGINEGLDKAQSAANFQQNALQGMSEGQQAQFKSLTPEQQWGEVTKYTNAPDAYAFNPPTAEVPAAQVPAAEIPVPEDLPPGTMFT